MASQRVKDRFSGEPNAISVLYDALLPYLILKNFTCKPPNAVAS
jgi:hypothetical protein